MSSAGVLQDEIDGSTFGAALSDADVSSLSDDELVAWSRLVEADRRRAHPGCDVASGSSQADHLLPHSHGGATSITNGGPGCGMHN